MGSRKHEQASELRKLKLKEKRAKREAKDPNYYKRIAGQRLASREEADRRTCGYENARRARAKEPTLSEFARMVGMPEIAKMLEEKGETST